MQTEYCANFIIKTVLIVNQYCLICLVAEGGFEPPTSGLWARRATAALLRDVLVL